MVVQPVAIFGIISVMALGVQFPGRSTSPYIAVLAAYIFCIADESLKRSVRSFFLGPKINHAWSENSKVLALSASTSPYVEYSPLLILALAIVKVTQPTQNFPLIEFFGGIFIIVILTLSWAIPLAYIGRNYRDVKFLLPFYSRLTLLVSPLIFPFDWNFPFLNLMQALNPLSFVAFYIRGFSFNEYTFAQMVFVVWLLISMFLSVKLRNSKSTRFSHEIENGNS
jgi:ABC-type polysaccharide/polyol phosphate export permease